MALFSTPMAAATVLLVDGAALREHGPWVGFNRYLLLTIGLGALGGIAVSFVFRFADNILKSFAVGCSIALNCVLSSCIFGLVVDRHSAVGIGLVALASTAYNVPPQCTWAALAWFGALLPRGPESNIAYARVRVAERAEDEHRVRALHVHLEVANLLEVVDVEEDAQLGDHLAQSLLHDAHLVLAGAPHVREEEVEVEWPRDEGRAHLWVSGREGCGSAVHEKGRISPCET